jgi:hypothetical protein
MSAFITAYLIGVVATVVGVLWTNRREPGDPQPERFGVADPNTYYDDGDGASVIVSCIIAAIIWPVTLFVFVYYRYFDKN